MEWTKTRAGLIGVIGLASVLCSLGLATGSARAQVREVDPEDASQVPAGAGENPADPQGSDASKPPVKEKPTEGPVEPVAEPEDYPSQIALRPLVLPRRVLEASMAFTANVSPFQLSGLLSGRFGVRDHLEAALRYSMGAFEQNGGDYTGGDVAAPEVDYEFLRLHAGPIRLRAAAEAALPMLFKHFSMGLVLGAPVKLTLFEKFSISVGKDFLAIAIRRFSPRVDDPVANEALVAADKVNSVLPDGEIRIIPEVLYQYTDHMALSGRFGVIGPDFSFADPPVVADVAATGTLGSTFDIELRSGFMALDHPKESFYIRLGVALRL